MAHAETHEIKNPGSYAVSGGFKTMLMVFAAIGLVAFGSALTSDPARAWAAFVQNHFFYMSIALIGLFFASIQWLTGAMWSAPVRRIFESFTSYLPVVLITGALLYFGIHHLYIWSHASHVQGDAVLEGKSGYLSTGFFMIRGLIAVALWIFFARKMIGNSIAQDSSKDAKLTMANRKLSPAFLIILGISFTMISFDQLMSLDPHWFSTMFGVYCFAGGFYAMLALTCLVTLHLMKTGHLKGIVNDNHLHDIGKFMFAFTVFWAYIAFCQFFLIWYANLPEETGYYMNRLQGAWFWVSMFLFAKFLVPFIALLPRDNKRNPKVLSAVAVFMLVAHWIDLMWVIQPEFFKEGPRVGITEIGVALGFFGLFGLVVSRFLSRNNVVAIGDPRLAESVFHHHQ